MTEDVLQIDRRNVTVGSRSLNGILAMPDAASGLILFAHGSGSSRLSPRNNRVADRLNAMGMGTLLFDLLTDSESDDRMNVFDIGLLSARVSDAIAWAGSERDCRKLPIGLFGASTGAAAALVAAADNPSNIAAIVSRGGRPDLADNKLADVKAPTLLIIGSEDTDVIRLNEQAFEQMNCRKHIALVPGASHLFEEPGTLDKVIDLASDWFKQCFSEWPGNATELTS